MSNQSARIVELGPDSQPEAVALLGRAFVGDPLMRYLLGDQGGYGKRLRAVFRYQCELQRLMGWPLLGLVPRTRLAGVVGVAMPEQPNELAGLARLETELSAALGELAQRRLDRYAEHTSAHFPAEPLLYVRMIGVRPESQGRGYAHMLLDEVQRRSEAHPRSTGVALDTENAENVEIYKRLGYQVVGRAQVDRIHVWCMFRPDR
jgi:ribosomal protein S18 acetylase RimI-like enzyme